MHTPSRDRLLLLSLIAFFVCGVVLAGLLVYMWLTGPPPAPRNSLEQYPWRAPAAGQPDLISHQALHRR